MALHQIQILSDTSWQHAYFFDNSWFLTNHYNAKTTLSYTAFVIGLSKKDIRQYLVFV